MPPAPRRSRSRRSVVIVLAAILFLPLGCAGRERLQRPTTDLAGDALARLVDSEPARRLLADLLARRSPGVRLAAMERVDAGSDAGLDPPRVPDHAQLRALAREVSLDYAALAFARALGADDASRAVQAAFDGALREDREHVEALVGRPGAFAYTVLFAPAWLYRTHPESGADFARQRRVLDRLGIAHQLIPSLESGSVEDNAAIVAAAVRRAARQGRELIVVSDSKSGAEVALALCRLLAPEDAAAVAAWVNLAGALGGTPLADYGLRPPVSWVVRAFFWLTDLDLAGPASMTTARSRRRLQGARIAASVAVVNVVAVPVSGSVGPKVYGGYKVLARHGPNDGVVLLADTVWPGGANLVVLGADHLLGPLQDDAHVLALLRAVDVALRLHRGSAPAAVNPLTFSGREAR